jgi:hypothetical protein
MKPGKDLLTLPALQARFCDEGKAREFLERAHVNTAESVHALFKRAIMGVFHYISGKHMGRYLREVEFHWNNRGAFEGRLTKLFATKAGPLPLKALFA